MKYIIRLCLVALFLFSLGLQSYGHDFPKQYTAAEKAETLSLLWSEVKYNFVFIDRIDFDIDSLYHAYMPKVLASRDDVEFMDLLSMFMASFGDGHTELGGRTQGSTGAPLVIDLPHGAWARICTISHTFPVSGREFVNEGIEPDVEISPTVDDYLNGYDRCMDYALKKIKEM